MAPPPSDNALLAAWQVTLARRGAAPALLSPEGKTLRTFAEIEAEAEALRATLHELPPESVVALQLGNAETWPAWIIALFRAGLIPLPLGRHLGRAELLDALRLTGAAALVTTAGLQFLKGSAALPETEFLKLTSGTTGAARAVRFRAHHLVADGDNICASMGISDADLNYAVIPLSHSYGFSNLLVPLLCRGVAMALAEDRLPRAILAGLAATGATVFPGMPIFFDKLAGLEDGPALPHLRLCLSAGAPLPPVVARAFAVRYGLKIHTFYGSSECGGIAYDASAEAIDEEGFLGTSMHGVNIAPVADGRIEIRSAAVGLGYCPEEDPALAGGSFTPGDLIRWSARGLHLAGRASDMINIAGRKLNPAEVEARLADFPGLRQAVVFGVPSVLRGEEPVVCVAGEQLDRATLQRFCHQQLSPWQIPRDIWIVPEILANDRGKISRRALAAEYLARRQPA